MLKRKEAFNKGHNNNFPFLFPFFVYKITNCPSPPKLPDEALPLS
jgi:hypothetical protein